MESDTAWLPRLRITATSGMKQLDISVPRAGWAGSRRSQNTVTQMSEAMIWNTDGL
jgi:hypothetical protein